MTDMEISDNKDLLNIDQIHDFLTHHSSWAKGIGLATVQTSIEHSLCFGAYSKASNTSREQIGFCRVITDYATFANLVDVIVWPEYRGLGVSKRLMDAVIAHPSLQGLRRFTLATADAHGLYRQFGFNEPTKPQAMMERYDPEAYCSASSACKT